MKNEFWLERWQKQEIGFHLDRVNPKLEQYFPYVQEQVSAKTVFVPLCGKTLDIGFLLSQGLNVIANELSESAVIELFAELDLQADITDWIHDGLAVGKVHTAQAGDQTLVIYQGDFFKLTQAEVKAAELVYDRAALIALPEEMRRDYGQHLLAITEKKPQLLITLSYDQAAMPGPPFSVTENEVHEHYLDVFDVLTMTEHDVIDYEPSFRKRGLDELVESVYFLAPELANDFI